MATAKPIVYAPLADAEFKALNETKSHDEWADVVAKIKKARGGNYPTEWCTRMLKSGLMAKIVAQWPKSDK
jgi:hypothetical protein